MKNNIIKSLLGFSLPSWINAFLGFVVIPIFTRLMLPEEIGRFNLFSTYSTLIFSISLLGLNQGYMRFYNEVPGRNNRYGLQRICAEIIFLSVLFFSFFILLFWDVISFELVGEKNFSIAVSLCVVIIASSFLNLKNSQYRMENNLLLFCFLSILLNFSGKCSYLFSVAIDGKGETAIIFYSASVFILFIFFYFPLKRKERTMIYRGKKEVFPVLKFSIPLVPVMLLSQLNAALPKLLMSHYLSYSDIGIYSSAYSVVSVISLIQAGFNIFWPPFVYENYKDNQKMLCRGHEMVCFFMLAFGIGILLFQDVLYLIIGENYRSSQSFFSLLLISPVFYTIAETTGIGINIAKKTYLNLITYGVGISVTFLISLLLLPRIGLTGAGIAVSISAFAMLLIRTIIGEKYYRVVEHRWKTAFYLVLFFVVSYLNSFFVEYTYFRIVLDFLIVFLLFIANRKNVLTVFSYLKSVKKRRELE